MRVEAAVRRSAAAPDGAAADRVGQLLSWLDLPGPRDTTHPSADRFSADFGAGAYRRALAQRAASPAPFAVCVQLPVCEPAGDGAALGKTVTRPQAGAVGDARRGGGAYLDALQRELALHLELLGPGRPVSQLHLGGGSSNGLNHGELDRLMGLLREAFSPHPGAELSTEVDPRAVDETRLRHLAALGFRRLSFGVQDLDRETQETVQSLMPAARAAGFSAINANLSYGLPRQTAASFARTVAQIGELRPDRIALHAQAQLPQRLEPRRGSQAHELPASGERVHMLRAAISGLQGMGYAHIGMDEFALPGDALARARHEGRLHRNFLGYGTHPDGDLIGLGVSAIGRVGHCHSQNLRTLQGYMEALAQDRFPVERGLEVEAEDLLRRSVVMGLMCRGRVEFDEVEAAHGVRFAEHFRTELERLRPFESKLLLELQPRALQLTPLGWYFLRAIARVFDRHQPFDAPRERHARTG